MTFRIIALTLMAVFYSCYMGKKMIQRKQGIQTFHIGREKKGFVKAIECSMIVLSVLTAIVELVSIVVGTTLMPVWVRYLGICFGTVGVLIFIIAILTMGSNWRVGATKEDKTELVTTGIFGISRNPAFLGFDLLYIGIFLMFSNWILCVVTCVTILLFHLQIVNVEETFLQEVFGDKYLSYKKSVNRYLGRK